MSTFGWHQVTSVRNVTCRCKSLWKRGCHFLLLCLAAQRPICWRHGVRQHCGGSGMQPMRSSYLCRNACYGRFFVEYRCVMYSLDMLCSPHILLFCPESLAPTPVTADLEGLVPQWGLLGPQHSATGLLLQHAYPQVCSDPFSKQHSGPSSCFLTVNEMPWPHRKPSTTHAARLTTAAKFATHTASRPAAQPTTSTRLPSTGSAAT